MSLGVHISHPFQNYIRRLPYLGRFGTWALSIFSLLAYVATIPVYIRASPSFRHQATAALLFCFPGTLTRYIFSIKLTPLYKSLPLGTLVANLLGTALLGTFHVLQRTPHLPGDNACAILQGLMDGYCGCLSTVSTFAVEVGALTTRRSWTYVAVSFGVSQVLLLVILGPSWWVGGINDNRACSFA